jgi:integrase
MKELPNCYISRHGIYYARLRIPAAFRQYNTQREIRLSLHTSKKALAFTRYLRIATLAERTFKRIKAIMSEDNISEAQKIHIWEALHQSERDRLAADNDDKSDITNCVMTLLINSGIRWVKKYDPDNIDAYGNDDLEDRGYEWFTESSLATSKARKSSSASREALVSESKQQEHAATLPAPTTSTRPSKVNIPPSSTTPSQLLVHIIDEKINNKRPMSKDIINRHKVLVLLLDTFLTERPVSKLSQEEWFDAYNLLSAFPKGVNKDNFSSLYPSIRQRYKDRKNGHETDNTELLGTDTLGTAQARLKNMCAIAYDNGWIVKNFLKPKAPAKRSKREKKKNKYAPFNDKEISALLNGYLYRQEIPPPSYRKIHHSWQFWFLPIALYTGMRRTEIAQLSVNDVKYDNENNIWYIHVNDEESRTTKSDASDRLIPIHSELADCGFLAFIEERRNSEDKSLVLFPHLWATASNSAKLRSTVNSDIISDWFIRKDSLRASKPERDEGNYFYDTGVNGEKKVLHSTRHTFVGQLRKLGIADIDMANVVGHEDGLMTRHYGEEQHIRENLAIIEQLNYGISGSLKHLDYLAFKNKLAQHELLPKRVKPRSRKQRSKDLAPRLGHQTK